MPTKPESRVFVIAEAGVNHNGSPEIAKKLIDAAADTGADAVKFQTFKAEKLVTARTPKARYQIRQTSSDESQLQMIKGFELSLDSHMALLEHSRSRSIQFMSTPFDLDSLQFLVEKLNLPIIKLGSGEITNGPLLLAAGRSRRKLILSTGMSDLCEIESALGAIAYGMISDENPSDGSVFQKAFASQEGRSALAASLTLMQCTTEYPAPLSDVNLRAMDTLRETFDLPVGFSDHSTGINCAIAAAARGATVIEKHLTLDRDMPGPDHRASLEPDNFSSMVQAIREVETALGTGIKEPAASEVDNIQIARKYLVAARRIKRGEIFTEENIAVMRCGNDTGLTPMMYWELLGKKAANDFEKDEVLRINE